MAVSQIIHVKIEKRTDRGYAFTVTPYGPIDSDTYLDFDDKTKHLLVSSTKAIVLDLANCDYISSAGLGVLFTMKKFLKKNSGELLFLNLKPQIIRLFEIVNALPKETIFKDAEEADTYLYKMMNRDKEIGDSSQ